MDDIMEELLDVFEEWCNECIDLEEIPLDFQRSGDDMGTYKELATEMFWTGWLGGLVAASNMVSHSTAVKMPPSTDTKAV